MTMSLPTLPVPGWLIAIIKLAIGLICIPIVYGVIGLGAAWLFNSLTGYPENIQWWQVVNFGGAGLGIIVIFGVKWPTLTKKLVFWSVGVAFLPPIIFFGVSIIFHWFQVAELSQWFYLHRYDTMGISLPCALTLLISCLIYGTLNRGKVKPPPTQPEI